MSVVSSVARISFLSSDVVVDFQPGNFGSSLFSPTYVALANSDSQRKPLIKSVPRGGDLEHALSVPLSTLTTLSHSFPTHSTISQLLLILPRLASAPLVIQLAVEPWSLYGALDMRSAASYVILSGTRQDAHDNALLAARLASIEKRAVLHIFLVTNSPSVAFGDIPESSIRSLLSAPARSGDTATVNGHSTAGSLPNGHANGHASDHANGSPNGHAKGDGRSRTDSFSVDLDESPESNLYRAYAGTALSTLALVRRAIRSSIYTGPPRPESVVVTLSGPFFNFVAVWAPSDALT